MLEANITAKSRLFDELSAWIEDELGERLTGIEVIHTHLRTYSEVHVLAVHTRHRTQRLVCKRSIHEASNEIYRHRGNAAQIEFDALRRVFPRLHQGMKYQVPRPRFVDPSTGLLVMDFVDGNSLEESMSAARIVSSPSVLNRAVYQFYRVGRWLRKFHSKMGIQYLAADVVEQTLAHCDDRLTMIQDCDRDQLPKSFRSDVMIQLDNLKNSIQGSVPVSDCHGDFGPWNILVNGDRVAVIDFFAHRRDCTLTDPLEMLVYLESQQYAPSFSARRIRRLQDAFRQGFGCNEEFDVALLRICEAHHRIRRMHDCLIRDKTTWRDRYRTARVFDDNLQWFRRSQPARFHRWSQECPSKGSRSS